MTISVDVLLLSKNSPETEQVQQTLQQVPGYTWNIGQAGTLAEGIELLSTQKYDLCLLSADLLSSQEPKQLSQLRQFCDLPIIVLNKTNPTDTGLRVLEQGASDYLNLNTLNAEHLQTVIRYVLKHHRLEQQLDKIFQHSHDAILIIDAESGTITEVNSRVSILTGYAQQELLKLSLQDLSGSDYPAWESYLQLTERKSSAQNESLTLITKSKHRISVYVSASLIKQKNQSQLILMLRDITERKHLLEELEFYTFHSSITGLPNRKYLEQQFTRLCEKKRRQDDGNDLTLLFADIRGFERLSASIGQDLSEDILRQVAQKFRHILRDHDFVAHIESAKFMVMIQSKHDNTARRVAQRLKEAFDEPLLVNGEVYEARLNIGLAEYQDEDSFQVLYDRVQQALLQARRKRNITFYDEAANQKLQEWLWIERSLKTALKKGEFQLVYQPFVGLSQSSEPAAEALLRWSQPSKGDISPDIFVPIAEETGLIEELDLWALGEAIGAASAHGFAVAVNISFQSLQGDNFVAQVHKLLDSHKFPASKLSLEVTERVLTTPEQLLPVVQALRDMGIAVVLDEFGTGHSSLSSLYAYPFSALKIDRQFIRNLFSDPRAQLLANTIVQLSQQLDIQTFVEGIETKAQLRWAQENRCDVVQGYLISKPLSQEDYLLWCKQYKDKLSKLGLAAELVATGA